MTMPALDHGFDARTVTDAEGAINEDLYCLSCGYNLRGLSGDPVRCPECGELNDLGAVAIPAEMIRKALRGMETAPTLCVSFAVLFWAVSGVLPISLWKRLDPPTPLLCLAFLAVAACAWVVARSRVRKSFQGQPGWKRVLVDFHVATLLCTLLIPLSIAFHTMSGIRWSRSAGVLQALAFAIAVPAFVWGLRIYYAARRRLAGMQRDRAVRIARDILWRALHRQK